jgi:hypothetical protein
MVSSVSCASAGNCAAGGYYRDSAGHVQAFVVDKTGGSWGTAREVPGSAVLNAGVDAGIGSVSCASAGNCAAGGYYRDSAGHYQAFVVDEAGGSWGGAREVPGSAVLNAGRSAGIGSVSCGSAGNCAAGGYYRDSAGNNQAFVVDEATATNTSVSLSAPAVTYGKEQAERLSVAVTSRHGAPGGTVTVSSRSTTVCTITLASGSGSCRLPAARLPGGTAQLTASYHGSAVFAASASAAKTLTVAKAASKTTLALSAAKVTYGKEQAEHVSVTVRPRYRGIPGGTVTVKAGAAAVCTITLKSGKGSCTLAATKLRPGTYTLIAIYSGSGDFTGAASTRKTLTVVK